MICVDAQSRSAVEGPADVCPTLRGAKTRFQLRRKAGRKQKQPAFTCRHETKIVSALIQHFMQL